MISIMGGVGAVFLALAAIVSFLLSGMAFEDESDRVSAIMASIGTLFLALYTVHIYTI